MSGNDNSGSERNGEDELPLGLGSQTHGGRAAPKRQAVMCDWCHRRIDADERVLLYVYRTPETPWMVESASCIDCRDDRVGIPTVGCDEVMVECTLRKAGKRDGYWYDLSDPVLLDRQGPTEGSDASEEEIEVFFQSGSMPNSRSVDTGSDCQ